MVGQQDDSELDAELRNLRSAKSLLEFQLAEVNRVLEEKDKDLKKNETELEELNGEIYIVHKSCDFLASYYSRTFLSLQSMFKKLIVLLLHLLTLSTFTLLHLLTLCTFTLLHLLT